LGRTLDAIYAAGTEQLFSQVAFRAAMSFPLDLGLTFPTPRDSIPAFS